MIRNQAILDEINEREKKSYEENYRGIYDYLTEEIYEEYYDFDYQKYLHFILRNFDIIPATKNFPSTLEVAIDLYIENNTELGNTENLTDPRFKEFLAELENFDDVFYEVTLEQNKMYRTVGCGEYDFVIKLNQGETTEETTTFIHEYFAGYAYKIIDVSDNVAVVYVEVDGDDIMFADIEILLYHVLEDGKIGTYTYEEA